MKRLGAVVLPTLPSLPVMPIVGAFVATGGGSSDRHGGDGKIHYATGCFGVPRQVAG